MLKSDDGAAGGLYRVQVLERTLAILDMLGAAEREVAPAELAAQLSLHKSTVHRLLAVLEHHGYIRRNPKHGKYALGLKLFELGSRAVAQLDLREQAEPFLDRLVAETGETAHICILDRGEMISVANADGPRTLRTPATVGRRTPAHCTSVGKAVLAFLPESQREAALDRITLTAYTPNTFVTRVALRAELRRVAMRGYAVDNEEIEKGLRCVGAPVRNHTDRVVASMSIAGPVFRVTRDRLPALAASVMRAAGALSAELGYAPTPDRAAGGAPPRVAQLNAVPRKSHR